MLDHDGGGSIDASELYQALSTLDIDVSEEEIQRLLKDVDQDGNGEIDFEEFLYAMSEAERYLELGDEGKPQNRFGSLIDNL